MNGYLERLVARHVGTPAIRPRARSMFEPGRVPDAQARIGAISDTTYAASPLESPGAAQSHGTITGASRRLPADETGSLVDHGRGPAFDPLEAREEPDDHGTDPRAIGSAAVSATSGGRQSPPIEEPSEVIGGTTEQGRAMAVEPPSTGSSGTPRTVSEPGNVRPGWQPEVTRPPSTVGLSRRDNLASRGHDPDVVQVHIGRVEVRAVMPTPEPSEPVRERPAPREPLSLERYLAGERRA